MRDDHWLGANCGHSSSTAPRRLFQEIGFVMLALRRRWYLFVAMLLAMAFGMGLWLILNPRDRITYANCREITTGIEQETAMLGPPSENRHPKFKDLYRIFGPNDETKQFASGLPRKERSAYFSMPTSACWRR
jgi:hypothetical protein